MARGFREEHFAFPSDDGPITSAEAAMLSPTVRRSMANVAELLAGSSTEQRDIPQDWSDPADSGTWKKPLTQGEL